MATETGYNGWTNYETWAVKLWIDNEQWSQELWLGNARGYLASDRPLAYESQTREQAAMADLAEQLKFDAEESADEYIHENSRKKLMSEASVFSDLMTHVLGQVNWYEIAKSLIEDAQEIPA